VLKKNNQVQVEVLVKWLNLDDEEATWESYDELCKQFLTFKLEDKLGLMGGVMSQLELTQERKRLGVVALDLNSNRMDMFWRVKKAEGMGPNRRKGT
jgi:Chromo (CHRromatin Organisation MOdifier) domain